MPPTIVEQLGAFAAGVDFDDLPRPVVDEVKRLLLDSVGCALAAGQSPKGRIGIEYGQLTGAGVDQATIIGTTRLVSVFGAAFANSELINALDFDAVLPPGHVTPYVVPSALALAESQHATGRALIVAAAVAHEMTFRIGRAMDYVRDIEEGKVTHPPVFGYSGSVFGAVSAVGRALGLSREQHAQALGIAGSIAPVNSLWSAAQRSQSTTIKSLGGVITQAAFTAAHLARAGHRGEIEILDDGEFGFARFIGSSRWEPAAIVEGLGTDWRFPAQQSYKIYPHCRVPAALMDALDEIVETHDLRPSEIDAIRAWGEPQGVLPMWTNRDIKHPNDAQFSIPHGLAVSAHRIRPRRRWQDPEVVWSPSVLDLMTRVTFMRHPDYERAVSSNPAARPSRLEVTARGTTYVAERDYPRGGRTPDPSTYVTTQELVAKFEDNACGILDDRQSTELVRVLLDLDDAEDVAGVMNLTRPASLTEGR